MEKFKNLLEKRWFAYTFATCSAVVLYMVLSSTRGVWAVFSAGWRVILPVVIGAVIAYLLNPIVTFLEKKILCGIKNDSARHVLGTFITMLLFLVVVVVLLLMLIPSVVDSISKIMQYLPYYERNLQRTFNSLTLYIEESGIEIADYVTIFKDTIKKVFESVPDNVSAIVSKSVSIGVMVFNFVIGLILAVYFLLGKNSLVQGINRLRAALFTPKTYNAQSRFFERSHKILIRFIGFDILDGVIVGLVNAAIMIIAGMPYVALVSVIVGVTNLLPTFGPMIGFIVGGFILLLVNPWQALVFTIMVIVIQTLDGYVIKPKLFGGALGVPAVWILVTVVIGGNLFGVAGILFAIPFAAIFSFIYEEEILPALINAREKRETKRESKKRDM